MAAVDFDAAVEHWSARWSDPSSYFSRRARIVTEVIARNVPRSKRILDVGCGTGAMVRMLGERGYRLAAGIDPGAALIARAVQESAGIFARPAEHFSVGSTDSITGEWDAITLVGVLPYLTDHRPALRNIRDHLAPGGVAVLVSTNAISLLSAEIVRDTFVRRGRLLHTTWNALTRGTWERNIPYRPWRQFRSARRLDRAMGRRGFALVDSVDLWNSEHPRYGISDQDCFTRTPRMARLVRRFGWNHIGVYRRG